MGVRHLETYVCKDVPNGYVKVNIDDEVRSRQNTLIVIDLMSLYSLFNKNKYDLLCGGRFQISTQQVEELFSNMKKSGAKLVFFYDGPVQTAKYETWISRQENKYKQCLEIMNDIERKELSQIVNNGGNFPNITSISLKKIAQKYGDFHKSIGVECDLEIAAYADKHNALAVISDDSDFMIYRGNWRYWSARAIDMESMTTMEYNRSAFLKHIYLSYDHLPLFATISGNDYIKYDDIKSFHRQIGSHRFKFQNIANYVRQYPLQLNDAMIHQILSDVFGSNFRPQLMDVFKKSLEVYNLNYKVANLNQTNDPNVEMLLREDHSFAYQIYSGTKFNVTPLFFDFRSNDMGDYFQIITPVAAKLAGIILYHKQSHQPNFDICMKRSHNWSFETITLKAIFPISLPVPPLLDLLSKSENMMRNFHKLKLELLCWVVSDKITLEHIINFDKVYLCSALTLKRLVETNAFKVVEADLIMLSLHRVITGHVPKEMQHPKVLNLRAFRLAFLFQKVYNHVERAFPVVGLPRDYETFFMFDGVYFHFLHTEFSTVDETRRLDYFTEIKHLRLH